MTTKLQRIRFVLMDECETCGTHGICRWEWGGPIGPHDGTGQGRCGCPPTRERPCRNCWWSLVWAGVIVWAVRAAALLAVVVVLFWLVGCSPEGNYDRCREELKRAYAAGEHVGGRPSQCAGVSEADLTRIIGEVLDSVPPPSTLD